MPDDLSQSTTGQIPTNLRLLVLLERIAQGRARFTKRSEHSP